MLAPLTSLTDSMFTKNVLSLFRLLPINLQDADTTVSNHNFAYMAENDSNYDEALDLTLTKETQE